MGVPGVIWESPGLYGSPRGYSSEIEYLQETMCLCTRIEAKWGYTDKTLHFSIIIGVTKMKNNHYA